MKQSLEKLRSAPQQFPDDKSQSSQFSKINVREDALNNLKKQRDQEIMEVPPTADSRKFNECDIIGHLDRDDKGNVLLSEEDKTSGHFKDKDGRSTNQRGYLIDPANGDVVNNLDGQTMFAQKDLDEKGEVPAPFSFEKHNFNPHQVRGDFEYDRNGRPVIG